MDRGQGFHQPNRGRSGGPHFSLSAGQPHRNQGQGRGRGRSSFGRGESFIYAEKRKGLQGESSIYVEKRKEGLQGESFIYFEKRKEGPIPSKPMSGVSSESEFSNASDLAHEETSTPPSSSSPAPMSGGRALISQISADVTTGNETLSCDFSIKIDMSRKQVETSGPFIHGDKSLRPSPARGSRIPESDGKYENSEQSGVFDIYGRKTSVPKLKRSLLDINRERRNKIQDGRTDIVLRSGMVLLKRYIPISEQVEIVKRCRDLGIGPGGFYQPGYGDGANLHLKMMCLGKNWDPETGSYGDHRPSDGSKPPIIPVKFYQLVEKAIRDAHSAIGGKTNVGDAAKLLPWMTPDICLVNFYSTTGRLGLHQDRDERQDSIREGLPVVSFSIGDSADFLYGDHRDVDNEDKDHKVVLESGDVLIFGGLSRNIFHGVTAINPNTAPKALLELTNLRPGRLNLTFRQY